MPRHVDAKNCAENLDDPRLLALHGKPRLVPREEFGTPLPCKRIVSHGKPGSILGILPRAIVIAGSQACFERTKQLALLPAGLHADGIRWSHAALSWPLNGSSCADTQGQRMTDGTVRGHREAWKEIASDGQPAFVLEEDAVLLGTATDIVDGLRQCSQRQCDLACTHAKARTHIATRRHA